MDSINRQQLEQTHQDLHAQDAIKKMRQLIEQSPTCFFCTAVSTGPSNAARPMSVQKVDDDGNLWFLSAIDSHKDQELMINPAAFMIYAVLMLRYSNVKEEICTPEVSKQFR